VTNHHFMMVGSKGSRKQKVYGWGRGKPQKKAPLESRTKKRKGRSTRFGFITQAFLLRRGGRSEGGGQESSCRSREGEGVVGRGKKCLRKMRKSQKKTILKEKSKSGNVHSTIRSTVRRKGVGPFTRGGLKLLGKKWESLQER